MLGLASLLCLSLAAPHPNSLSSSRLRVEGAQVFHTLRCQVASLLEVVGDLDPDGDGRVSASEIERRRGEIFDYVGARYVLRTGAGLDLAGGARLRFEPIAARLAAPPTGEDDPFRLQDWVDVETVHHAGEPIRDLLVESTLFADTSPDHKDLCRIEWEGGFEETLLLDRDRPRARSAPGEGSAFRAFLVLGWKHILAGWDHLAFLAVLVLATRRFRSLLGVVTAFTLAHSCTLALAAFEIVDVSGHARLVEAGIALSIAYVATENLLFPMRKRAPWPEAFGFGLLHGLGFAGFLAESLVRERSKGLALFAFNVGVEGGQLLVVSAMTAVVVVLPRKRDGRAPFLAPLLLRRAGSGAAAIAGFAWFFERL